MKGFTEKEKDCLVTYVQDLLRVMEEENLLKLSDNQCSYTLEEIKILSEKVNKFL